MTITMTGVIREIRRIASEQPEHVYRPPVACRIGCSYVDSANAPGTGCIVGQAVIALGLPVERLAEWENGHDETSSTIMLPAMDIGGSRAELRWIRRVQSEQDQGKAWGEAVAIADQVEPLSI